MESRSSSFDGGAFGRLSPPSSDHRRFVFERGCFATARRGYTEAVEGTIKSDHALIMATLEGGADRHDYVTDCGYRYAGPDRAGTVSFLPAGCERRLTLKGVAWRWASLSLSPALLAAVDEGGRRGPALSFSAGDEPFLFGMLAALAVADAECAQPDGAYCDAMAFAAASYLARRSDGRVGSAGMETRPRLWLPQWRLRRIDEFVDAHIGEEIRVARLAELVGLSEGHLHRAFVATVGATPLQFINRRRVERAKLMLATPGVAVVDAAAAVGFQSPSHFARVFRSVTGYGPAEFARAYAK